MIQTSIEPDGFDDDVVFDAALSLLLSDPPQATSVTAAASSAPAAINLRFIDPPRRTPPRVVARGWDDPEASPCTATPVARPPAALWRPASLSALSQGRTQLGHEPVPIAAIDRPHELHHLPSLALGRPLEQEGGGVERHAENLRLLLARDRRLDRLDARRDDDPEALAQQLVERVSFEVLALELGDDPLGYVEKLDGHRLVVGEPEPPDRPHLLGGGDPQPLAELGAGADGLERQDAAARAHAAAGHVLRERGHGQRQRDLRLGHVGAAAMPAHQQPLADELVDGLAEGRPRDAERDGQAALGRDGLADPQLVEHAQQLVADQRLLGGDATVALRGLAWRHVLLRAPGAAAPDRLLRSSIAEPSPSGRAAAYGLVKKWSRPICEFGVTDARARDAPRRPSPRGAGAPRRRRCRARARRPRPRGRRA